VNPTASSVQGTYEGLVPIYIATSVIRLATSNPRPSMSMLSP